MSARDMFARDMFARDMFARDMFARDCLRTSRPPPDCAHTLMIICEDVHLRDTAICGITW